MHFFSYLSRVSHFRRCGQGLLLGALSSLFCACQGRAAGSDPLSTCPPNSPADWPLRVFLRSSPDMNANREGESLDTRIRILQLRSLDRLSHVSQQEVWTTPKAVLGKDLLHAAEHTLFINQPLDLEIRPFPKASHIVVSAWMRNPKGDKYWHAAPIPLNYRRGLCTAFLDLLPNPCLFVHVGARQVELDFEPPQAFDRRGIRTRCPSRALLQAKIQRKDRADKS